MPPGNLRETLSDRVRGTHRCVRKAEQTIVPQMLPLTFSQDLPTLTICRFRLCMVGPCYVDFRKLIKCWFTISGCSS
jgi:hypothetical protein